MTEPLATPVVVAKPPGEIDTEVALVVVHESVVVAPEPGTVGLTENEPMLGRFVPPFTVTVAVWVVVPTLFPAARV